MRSWKILIFMLSIVPLSLAAPMASLDCPATVYINEFFSCTAYLYSYSGGTDVSYSFTSDGKLLISDSGGTASIQSGGLWTHEFNVWAVEGGKGMVILEYGSEEEKQAHVAYVYITEPPIKLSLPRIQLSPGRRATAKIKVKGKANDVRLLFSFPPTLSGEEEHYVGDVSGEKVVSVDISADPFAVGDYPVDVYVIFFDKTGRHVLRYTMNVEVGIPLSAWLALIAVILVLGAGYGYWRKKKQEKSS